MSNIQIDTNAIEAALMVGDLSKLNSDQLLSYYRKVCESVGLNPLTKPFEYMKLNGKQVLYAGKNCAEQLRKLHGISIHKIEKESDADTYTVVAYAKLPDGREDASTGVVGIGGMKGEALANAKMKCETKAKRRVTLSIIGLGMLDETEVQSIIQADVHPKEVQSHPIEIPAHPGDFLQPFGKGKGRKISEIDAYELENMVKWCIEKDKFHDFIVAAEAFMNEKASKQLPQATPEPNFDDADAPFDATSYFDEPIPDMDGPNVLEASQKLAAANTAKQMSLSDNKGVVHKHIYTKSMIDPQYEKCMIKLADGQMCSEKRLIQK